MHGHFYMVRPKVQGRMLTIVNSFWVARIQRRITNKNSWFVNSTIVYLKFNQYATTCEILICNHKDSTGWSSSIDNDTKVLHAGPRTASVKIAPWVRTNKLSGGQKMHKSRHLVHLLQKYSQEFRFKSWFSGGFSPAICYRHRVGQHSFLLELVITEYRGMWERKQGGSPYSKMIMR